MDTDTEKTGKAVGSLAATVAAAGPLGFTDVLTMGVDVSTSLAELHEHGEVHGCVHPKCVVRAGDGPWVLAAPSLLSGVQPARAPELAAGSTSTPGDVYALGATLVFGLTGTEIADDGTSLGSDAAADDKGDAKPDATGTDAGEGAAASPAAAAAERELLTLPEVMSAFLDTLRLTLATDPSSRCSASDLAATLRRLRADADRALAPPSPFAPGAAVATAGFASIGTADDPILIPLEGDGEGADGAGATSTAGKQPNNTRTFILAGAAVIIAAMLAFALGRRTDHPELVAAGDTGTSLATTTIATTTTVPPSTDTTASSTTSSSTTTTKPTTTVPVQIPVFTPPTTAETTTAPPTTLPAGVVVVTVNMSNNPSCNTCPANVRVSPSLVAGLAGQVADATRLWGTCFVTGDQVSDSTGWTSNQWLKIVGPNIAGWLPITWAGRTNYGLPTCAGSTPSSTTTSSSTTTTTAGP